MIVSRDTDPVLSGMSGKIADFRLDGFIGQSATAVVYLALDERSGPHPDQKVALKVLAPELARDDAFRDQFLHECRAAAAVEHPHIIPVYAAGEAGGSLYVAMRYVQGGDARSLLNRYGPLPVAWAWDIIAQVASALDAAHAGGVIHRDVKPTNMLLDSSSPASPGTPRRADGGDFDHVYLSDFGMSTNSVSADVAATGQFAGTLDYVAPEQIEGRAVDGRADLYSLACSGFELLCGAPPFGQDQGLTVMYAQMYAPPPTATARRDLPPAVDRVLATALAKNPADRYATCGQFAEELHAALGLAPGPAPASGPAAVGPLVAGPATAVLPLAEAVPPADGIPPYAAAPPYAAGPDIPPHAAAPPYAAGPDIPPHAAAPPYAASPDIPPYAAAPPYAASPDIQPYAAGPDVPPYAAGAGIPPHAAASPYAAGPDVPPYAAGADIPPHAAAPPYAASPDIPPYATVPSPVPSSASDPAWPASGRLPPAYEPPATDTWLEDFDQPPMLPPAPMPDGPGWFRDEPPPPPGRAGPGQPTAGLPAAPGRLSFRPPQLDARTRRLLLTAGAVVVVIVAAVLGIELSSGSAPGKPAAATPSGSATPSAATTVASRQAASVNTLLGSSLASRRALVGAVADVRACTNLAGSVSQIQQVVNRRSAEYQQASALSVAAIANGPAVKSDLLAALRNSLSADRDYLIWARRRLNFGCSPGAAAGIYAAAVAADSQAAASKQAFVQVWNPVAARYGMPPKSADSI